MSKRRVSPEDVLKCEERYSKSRAVNIIVSHVSHKLDHPIEDIYEKVVWPLHRVYGHSYDAFKLSVTCVACLPVSLARSLRASRWTKTCAASSRRTSRAA